MQSKDKTTRIKQCPPVLTPNSPLSNFLAANSIPVSPRRSWAAAAGGRTSKGENETEPRLAREWLGGSSNGKNCGSGAEPRKKCKGKRHLVSDYARTWTITICYERKTGGGEKEEERKRCNCHSVYIQERSYSPSLLVFVGREKEKDVLLRDSRTSALISRSASLSRKHLGTSPRSTLSPFSLCFFIFLFLSLSARAFFSRCIYSTPMHITDVDLAPSILRSSRVNIVRSLLSLSFPWGSR